MSVKVSGMKALVDHFDKINSPKPVKKAVREGGKVILKQEKETARHVHKKYATGKGAAQLKLSTVRSNKKRAFVDAGIGKKSNWEAVKGLYYNHYGFYHSGWNHDKTRKKRLASPDYTGTYIAGSRWMDTAFDKSISNAYQKVEDVLMEEFNK